MPRPDNTTNLAHTAVARALVVFLLTLLPLAAATHRHVFMAGNDASRFAQMQAVVDLGVTHIDNTRYAWTVDRVRIDGHDYSNKPPVLSLIGAGVYKGLQLVTGWTFAGDEARVVYWLTLLLVGVPTAALVAVFDRALLWHDRIGLTVRAVMTATLAFATILTTFSTTMNNHTVAAALLFGAFVAAMRGAGVWTGALAGLAICIDIVPGAVLLPVLGMMVATRGEAKARGHTAIALGACGLIFVAANVYITGSLLPAKMVRGAVDASNVLPGGTAPAPGAVAGVLLPDRWMYPLECLFGWHGFFAVSPVLMFSAVGLALAIRRLAAGLRRGEIVALTAAMGIIIVGHILLVGSYGGWSYGFRYLIPVIPLMLFFTPVVFTHATTRLGRAVLAAIATVYVLVFAVSVLFAWIGVYHPWPPAYEQQATANTLESTVTNPVGGNAAAWMQAHYPTSDVTRVMMRHFISDEPRRAYMYLHLFYASKGDIDEAQRIEQRARAREQLLW